MPKILAVICLLTVTSTVFATPKWVTRDFVSNAGCRIRYADNSGVYVEYMFDIINNDIIVNNELMLSKKTTDPRNDVETYAYDGKTYLILEGRRSNNMRIQYKGLFKGDCKDGQTSAADPGKMAPLWTE